MFDCCSVGRNHVLSIICLIIEGFFAIGMVIGLVNNIWSKVATSAQTIRLQVISNAAALLFLFLKDEATGFSKMAFVNVAISCGNIEHQTAASFSEIH